MNNTYKEIAKKFAFFILCVQLIFTLSGFISNVNPSDCCHSKKEIIKVNSCCEEMEKLDSMDCESSQPLLNHSLSNCGCIHTNIDKNSVYTVQKNFELQKENQIAVFSFYIYQQTKSFNSIFKQRIVKEHSPPLFLLDSTLLI